MRLNLSPESWGRVVATTLLGTTICIAVAVYADSFNFQGMNEAQRFQSFILDIMVPTVLAVPLLLFFSMKLRELAIAHHRLAVYAATDGLTQVMNRSAFSALVEAKLGRLREQNERARGALLIIDADNFKTVNDRFGHDSGDQALIAIANSIKAMVREPDLVGRIGGEEFGVFLPDANPEQAESVAERIRQAVGSARFAPAGAMHRLSVSVGGAVFSDQLPFAQLFRLADHQLYLAKELGRDRIAIALVESDKLGIAA